MIPVVRWDFKPPPGVTLYEHCKTLPLMMMETHRLGERAGIFIVSCEVAAILESLSMPRIYEACFVKRGPIVKLGDLHNIPVWLNADIIEAEVMVTDQPDDIYPIAKLVIENLVEDTVLDYLARI